MKRRASDSNGKRGKIETPEAQLRRLDSLPVESGRPQRNGTDFSLIQTFFMTGGVSSNSPLTQGIDIQFIFP
ncbi:hypothetical protein VL06_15355 [Rossellomorea marisflavi]|uniref:Uncharacterized protein n=1 Tax=Rossellomorea marisflavi TaxID=189381 RepID=A0A0J5SCL9_9BACI|nr:hypothetical protein VL03_09015 [Rossellomorea marisflavi]KML03033.1 hypothetical protein VL06_15355 [Rossellomorea marisflavi]KZE50819.1 hypothetical protein AV649_15665 [Rossellomorea marisflavi]